MSAIEFGPVRKLLDDPDVSEIMINSFDKIFVEKNGKKVRVEAAFTSREELQTFVESIFRAHNKHIGPDSPYADVCLEDGTRVNAIIQPVSRFGTSVTFRKFSKNINTLDDLVKASMLTRSTADFLAACIKARINMLISGGTGVGKTTLLQTLTRYFPPDERTVTIEDAAELKIGQDNIVSLETRMPDSNGKGEVTLRDLARNALRMSPDRLIFGEVRGGEALDMLQAMSMGNPGSIGIVHGNRPEEALSRLESMVLMLGLNLQPADIKKMISNSIQVVVHIERLKSGFRRVTSILELRGMKKDGEILCSPLYSLQNVTVDGEVISELRPVFQSYPLFLPQFEAEGFATSRFFVRD